MMPGTDAATDLDDDEVLRPLVATEEVGREGRGARVVGDDGRKAVALLEDPRERQVLPVEVDRPADRAVRVDHARRADPDAEEGARGLTPDVVDELVDELDGLLAVTALELAGAFRGEFAAQVREGGGEGALAEVERDDAFGRRP